MFHVHGVAGHVFSGSLEELRHHRAVSGVARVRRIEPVGMAGDGDTPPAPPPHDTGADTGADTDTDTTTGPSHPIEHEALQAYGQAAAARVRQPLRCVADVMRSPALTVPASATVREAWQTLAQHGIGQAPVVDGRGALVGLVGRAELMPVAALEALGAAAEQARLSQPVTAVMWTPVPSTAPSAELRRVAALLLDTGLPGVPVADAQGAVLGFVSRTDLLRALATDPPLDLWG